MGLNPPPQRQANIRQLGADHIAIKVELPTHPLTFGVGFPTPPSRSDQWNEAWQCGIPTMVDPL